MVGVAFLNTVFFKKVNFYPCCLFCIFVLHLLPTFLKAFSFVVIISIWGCKSDSVKTNPSPIDTNADTLTIVKKFCGSSCHLLPEPYLLDKKTWATSVLPNMGCRLGIQTAGYNPYSMFDMEEIAEMVNRNVYPDSPLVSKNDWSKILAYFDAYSPDSINLPISDFKNLTQFQVIPYGDKIQTPRVTLLKYDSIAGKIHVGLEKGVIYSFNPDMSHPDTITIGKTPLDFLNLNDTKYILALTNMYPSEKHRGSIIKIEKEKSKSILVKNLHRPVHMTFYSDGLNDHFIISEFGFESGSLSAYQFGNDTLIKQQDLLPMAGSVKTILTDIDGDANKEIIALMAQGRERVVIFKHTEKGWVDPATVLTFPPVHGVCDIDIADMNKDGRPDIIISNGDNADFSITTKPFHGITVYHNQGNMQFSSAEFIPYPNILHSEIADFDLDGDLDIASTAFFSHAMDQRYPAFIYFEHLGDKFVPYTFSNSNRGKWMTIELLDMDRDGDQDIFMGSFLLNSFMVEGSREDLQKYALVLLKNTKK